MTPVKKPVAVLHEFGVFRLRAWVSSVARNA